jgi:hypothetical protein
MIGQEAVQGASLRARRECPKPGQLVRFPRAGRRARSDAPYPPAMAAMTSTLCA